SQNRTILSQSSAPHTTQQGQPQESLATDTSRNRKIVGLQDLRNAPKSSLSSAVPPELPMIHFRLNFPLASYGLPPRACPKSRTRLPLSGRSPRFFCNRAGEANVSKICRAAPCGHRLSA